MKKILRLAYTAIKGCGAFPDEKTILKGETLMQAKEYGLFCMDQAPEMPNITQESSFPAHISLAMAYVPYQRFENLYDEEKALSRGTLFAELDMPFYGGKRGNGK